MKKKENPIPQYILVSYIFLMLCIYPLYFDNGYYNIGITKNNFFSTVTIAMVLVMLVVTGFIIYGLVKRKKTIVEWKKISITEKLLYTYMFIIIVSYVGSPYKETVLWGAEGWYMGTLPLLMLSVTALWLMHMWKEQKWILYGCVMVSGIVFFLGICNRFTFYPITMEPINPTFISTLGNINWFCGYMSVIAPIGISLFTLKDRDEYKSAWGKWFLALYVLITFAAGFAQGSESVLLWNGAAFVALLWISAKKIYRLKNWMLLVALWGFAGQLMRVIKALAPDAYNYNKAGMIDTNLTLIVAIVAILFFVLLSICAKKEKELPVYIQIGIQVVLVLSVVLVIFGWLFLAIYHTNKGIEVLEGNSLFMLDENWGNARGTTFKAAFVLFGEMTPIQKLVGIGADGFKELAYSIPEVTDFLSKEFGKSVLTNAHSEIITHLVNLGALGTTAFLAMLITFMGRCMKRGKENSLLYIPGICVLCYLSNNIISFAQILNTPFLFYIIGIGEYYLRKYNHK